MFLSIVEDWSAKGKVIQDHSFVSFSTGLEWSASGISTYWSYTILYYSLMRSCCQSLGPMHCNGFMYHSHKAIVMALFCIIFIGCWPLSRPWRADYFGCFRFHHNRCDSGWYQITTSEQIILMPNKNNNINNCFYHQNNDNWCQLTATMAKNNFLCFVSIILKTFLVYVR